MKILMNVKQLFPFVVFGGQREQNTVSGKEGLMVDEEVSTW